MGRTLMGIDLDESPFGGIIERLLDEEELEALDAVPDGGTDDADADTDAGFAGRNVSSDSDADRSSDSGVAETPSPGADDDSRERILAEFADADEEGEDSADGRLAGIRSRLRPLAAALAVLAVLAVVAALVFWRYGDRIAAALPGPLGGGDNGADHSATDEFDSATGFGPDADASDSAIGSDEDATDGTGPSTSATGAGEDEDEAAGAAAGSSDGDLGALVGLAFLAVVAVIVRKFAEERDHDPLVDGDR